VPGPVNKKAARADSIKSWGSPHVPKVVRRDARVAYYKLSMYGHEFLKLNRCIVPYSQMCSSCSVRTRARGATED